MNKLQEALSNMHARPMMYDFTKHNEDCGDIHYDILNDFIKIQLTSEEIEFLLMSEEERFNRFGQMYAYELYVSSKEKLERQKGWL